MANGVTISITGVKEIDNVLKNLPDAVSHKVLGAAHAAAAKPLIIKEQLLAPEGPTGNLVDSIGVLKTSLKKANAIGEVIAGPRRGGRYKGYAAHLVEYGTQERELKGRGKYPRGTKRGRMRPEPFAKPAFEQTKGEVERRIAEEVGKSLNRTMNRYIK
jgi:HK97 gp10 family phage protein